MMRTTPSRRALVLGVTALAVGIGGSVAYATIPDSNGVINGCYNGGPGGDSLNKGQLRVVESTADCRQNETPISWNETGPKGDQGVQGVQGPAGAAGPAGPPGPVNARQVLLSGNGYLVPNGSPRLTILSMPAPSGTYLAWAYVQARLEGSDTSATASCNVGNGQHEDLSIRALGNSVLAFPSSVFVPPGASLRLECTSFLAPVRYYNARLYAVPIDSLASSFQSSP